MDNKSDAEKFLITIIIPTKDRYETLTDCLRTFEKLEYQDIFEVLVFDSSANRSNFNIKEFKIKNIRYVHEEVSGFCETFSRSLDHATGKYVTIIGDDDAVLPALLDAASWAFQNNVDSITPLLRAGYIWPGVTRQVGGAQDADRLLIQKFTSKITKVEAKEELERVVSNVFQDFDKLPKIYHGVVRLSKMKEVKLKYGDYFIGSSPDISAAVALADIVDSHFIVDFPLTLPGSSPRSGAGTSLSGKHIGSLENSPLGPFSRIWPLNFPKIYTVQTMWAFSGTYVLLRSPSSSLFKSFKSDKLLAATLIYNLPNAVKILQQELKRQKINWPILAYHSIGYVLKRARQLMNRITRKGNYDLIVDKRHLGSIVGAQEITNMIVQKAENPFREKVEL
ncbi:glycosyltransferase family 2 protein [Deinococcus sp. RIT780]|uniref:glycosyltransferase family 2 protein n=1 Tax=Deinococcus sp. RIT780 TaxID=2870472 RepID=UPI001C897BEB|nr:glycosyltransferase family A protein [Deinococcus sp. RIT780]MBX8465024.1 glycosyltransferase family 2 protein [Deinococcus sp. RIT780]